MATYEMSQVQSRIILVVMTIICVGVFITMPVEKLSCDRSKMHALYQHQHCWAVVKKLLILLMRYPACL